MHSMKLALLLMAGVFVWAVPLPRADSDPQPSPCTFVAPIYPPLARLAHGEATISLQASVDSSGEPGEVEVLHHTSRSVTTEMLERSAVDAMRKWRYCPAAVSPSRKIVVVTFKFKLRMNSTEQQVDQWYPTEVSFQSPDIVEIETTTSTIRAD
jgi:TonB family protein